MKYILILIYLLLSACDPGFTLLIDGKEKKVFDCECGKINILAKTFIYQPVIDIDFILNDTISIFLDSIRINHKSLESQNDFSYSNKVNNILYSFLKINPNLRILDGRLYIGTSNLAGVHYGDSTKGDTVKVFSKGFIKCKGKSVLPDTLNLVPPIKKGWGWCY